MTRLAIASVLLVLALLNPVSATFVWYGPNVCTGQQYYTYLHNELDVIDDSPSLTIPPQCLPSPSTSEKECQSLAALWATRFPYCCPIAYIYKTDAQPLGSNQVQSISDPNGLGAPTLLLTDIPSHVSYVKWVGEPGGCRMIWDCSALTKSERYTLGPLCY